MSEDGPHGDYDENQSLIPEAFLALYQDNRRRLTAPRSQIAERFELCEDLAQLLTEQCRLIHFRDGIDEATVLQRVHQGLISDPSTVSTPEAEWVVRRTAELIDWPTGVSLDG